MTNESNIQKMLDIGIYTLEQAAMAAAELDYYDVFGELPEWACYIEGVVIENDSLIIIHRDASNAN